MFKSRRRSRASYTTNNQHGTIRIEGDRVRLPKVGFVRFTQHRGFDGEIRSATVSMTRTGRFFVSLLVEQADEPWVPAEHIIGVDLGLEHFATMTNGKRVGGRTRPIRRPRSTSPDGGLASSPSLGVSRPRRLGSRRRCALTA
ncbi:RNA-guided endonuclease TnpB family protein, partial [Bacillus subtilis]